MTLPPPGPGPTAIPPKLPVADGTACCALNGPQTPRPVTGAPRATILPLWFQSTHTLPMPTAIEGWSTMPVPTVTGALNVTPPSVLKITLIWSAPSLMYTRKRLPNVSQAACPSQHATPVAMVPRVQLEPPSVEYARKMLPTPGGRFEKATRLFVLVGLTFTKLSAWLSAVALTLTTASRQVSGANRSVGFGARSLGLMHLRVSMPSVGASTCACNMDVAGVSNAKTAARIISRRRVFICVFLLMRRVRMDLRKRASDAILEVLRTSGEVYFVTSAS